MPMFKIRSCVVSAAVLAGTTSILPLSASGVPDAIAAHGETLVATVHATGVQVYECRTDAGGKLAWQFREPVATLHADGKTVGRHYAGPHWEMTDGSIVSAKVSGRAPGASENDIPLLKLDVTSWRGTGQLAGVTTIQRVNTKGGVAEGACEAAGDMLSVPYAAEYTFFRKAAAQTVSQPSARGPSPAASQAYVASPAVVVPPPAIGVIVVRGDDRDWRKRKKKTDGQPKGPKGPVTEPTTPPPATPPTPPTAEPKMPPEKATPGKATPNTGTPGPVVRDHRTPKPAPEVRDHRAKPKVRDHRESATASNQKTGTSTTSGSKPSGTKICGFAGLPPCK